VRSYDVRVVAAWLGTRDARVLYRATTPGGFSIIEAFKKPLKSLRAVRLFAALYFPEALVTNGVLNAASGVIRLSSIASAGEAQAAIYSGTKGAVDAITRALAAELGPRKIRVNAIAPGGVETEGTHSAGILGSDFEKQMVAGTPLGRFGQPDDIARVAVFLASEDSAWLTGERLTASGGYR
jgi:NAD(P)-dependent dehydrogenase (short-subunit alcohol dehydrogenase family)